MELSWLGALTMMSWMVIGVGNEFRGDDAAGCVVARELAARGLGGVRVMEHQSDGTALLRYFQDAENLLLVDAVTSGKSPGTVHRLDLRAQNIPANFIHNSSHLFGIPEAVAIARELGQLPSRLIFYGIEGARFETGAELSPGMNEALPKVMAMIEKEISETL